MTMPEASTAIATHTHHRSPLKPRTCSKTPSCRAPSNSWAACLMIAVYSALHKSPETPSSVSSEEDMTWE